jgi:hypothetical protein
VKPLNIEQIRQQITALLLQYPELGEDEVLRTDMIEGSTDTIEFLNELERRHREAWIIFSGLKVVLADLAKRADRFANQIAGIKQLMHKVLDDANLRKVRLATKTLTIIQGKSKVLVLDETELPEKYWRVHREPDKQRIHMDIEAGIHVPGATLSNSEPYLRIG